MPLFGAWTRACSGSDDLCIVESGVRLVVATPLRSITTGNMVANHVSTGINPMGRHSSRLVDEVQTTCDQKCFVDCLNLSVFRVLYEYLVSWPRQRSIGACSIAAVPVVMERWR